MSTEQTTQVQEQEAPQGPQLTFAQYKQRLKNEVEISELRARIAKANFEELAALNQYTQLRAHIAAASQPRPEPVAEVDGPTTEEVEIPVDAAQPVEG